MIAVSTIQAALKKELGSYFSTEAHRDWDIIRYINSAVRAIVIAKNFQFNNYEHIITVTPNITTYTIPFQIETFFILDSAWMEVQFEDFVNYNRIKNVQTKPLIWIWGENLTCTNPWTYTIYYRGYAPLITQINDSLAIPEHFFDLVVLKASYFGFMDIRAYNKANNKESIFKGMIKDLATRSSDTQPTKRKRLNKSVNNSSVW